MNPHNLAVGQKLWFVARGRSGSLREVTKVGRQWAHLGDNCRIDLAMLQQDGYGFSSPGRAYLSKEAFDAENALVRAWDQFLRACQHLHRPPAGVTLADIRIAGRVLRVQREEPNG